MIVVMIALYVVFGTVLTAVSSWWLMILFGALHSEVSSAIPALGFFQMVLVVLALAAVGSALNMSSIFSASAKKG